MGLEAFSYITSLNSSNPVGASDPKSEGDDHLRGIKSVLLASFPSISGAVTLSHTQINDAALKSAANTLTGNLTLDDVSLILEGGLNNVTLSHDGTDLNIAGTGTTDINLTGITALQAGTVDADFDAITATSYGGIAEANLLDKSAAETVSGAWAFGSTVDITGALTAASFGGITSANLLDKSATETVSGAWTFSSTLNGKDPDQFAEEDTALTATNSTASQPGFKGCPVRSVSSSDGIELADCGKIVRLTGGSGQTLTIPANSSIALPVGTIIAVVNDSGNDWSIAITTDTLEEYVTGNTGTRTLADNGKAVLEKVTSTLWKVSGLGVS